MANVVLPLGMKFKDWTDQIRQDLPDLQVPIADDVDTWRDWASQLVNDNALSNVPVPTDLCYPNDDDWLIWASYFVDSVTQLTRVT